MTKKTSRANTKAYDTIEAAIRGQWHLGRNIILCWTRKQNGLVFLSCPYYLIGSLISPESSLGNTDNSQGLNILTLIMGTRQIDMLSLNRLKGINGIIEGQIELHETVNVQNLDNNKIDEILRRYSISYVENHAVALFDIVGFSKYTPFEQVTLLSSLSYSINAAHAKLQSWNISISFAHTTTGDGFYIWSKEPSIDGNVNLYLLMQLVLADNAIAQTKSYAHTAPVLKTGFHIGNYYEFHQPEDLRPTPYNFIVGDATIELARIIEDAMAGQILVGDFHCKLPMPDSSGNLRDVNTASFIDILSAKTDNLSGFTISGSKITSIVCYLTGTPLADQQFSISQYQVEDKHHFTHAVYNAKVNIYRENKPPIFLGIQEKDVLVSSGLKKDHT